jgi:hypothetical protein
MIFDVVDGHALDCLDEKVVFVMDVVGKLFNWDQASCDCAALVTRKLLRCRSTYQRDAS